MKDYKQYEIFGTLEKFEQFNTLSQNIIPGSLVFESPSPFCGYYNEYPMDFKSPYYAYIAILPNYNVLDVTRAFQKVRGEYYFDFDAAKADVRLNDLIFSVIRLRHIDNYLRIKDIQKSFVNNGISMLMGAWNWKNVKPRIQLEKIFYVEKISNTIYLDTSEPYHSYIEIPKKLTFDEFVTITQKVLNNWMGYKFDAALGAFLQEQRVIEVVRIYSEHQELETLEAIQNLYVQKIQHS